MTTAIPESQDPGPPSTDTDLGALTGFRRPRLRPDVPILWRDQTTIQLGDDVRVDRIDRSHVAWLTSLDGLATSADVLASLTIPEADAARLIRAALAAGALDDAARMPAAHRWLAPTERDRAAARFGATLATHRELGLAMEITDARDRARAAVVGDGELAAAMEQALGRAGLTVDATRPQVIVLADAPHPDVPALMDHLGLSDPHLHVGVYGRSAVVGPLVVPGRTGCLRCTHLHRRDADPAWPLLAVQWAQAVASLRPAPTDPLLAGLAATHAALLLRTWIDLPEAPDAWADHALEITLPCGEVVRRERPPHPLCGCRWLE
ncbi:MAG: hypothetical protein GC156_08770 [Actinomycetales bacterium]|nr:hypothetical protein [Actinomycetales bacterium]